MSLECLKRGGKGEGGERACMWLKEREERGRVCRGRGRSVAEEEGGERLEECCRRRGRREDVPVAGGVLRKDREQER